MDIQVNTPNINFTPNKRKYAFFFMLRSKLPQKMYSALGKLTFNTTMKKNAERLRKINQKGDKVNQIMAHFTCNEWIFDSPLYHKYIEFVSPEEKQDFDLDLSVIKWKHFTYLYCYGTQVYVLKQKDVPLPQEDFDDVIAKQGKRSYFNDILWASNRGKLHIVRKQKDVINVIINSKEVQKAILEHINSPDFQKLHTGYSESEQMVAAELIVKGMAEELSAKMRKSVIKTAAWAAHKVLKRMYDKIIVDMKDLKMICKMQEESKNPILLVPTRKSYIDMILLGYIFFANGLKQPFFSTPSQYQEIKLLNKIFRYCGSFYIREDENNPLYQAVLNEYLSMLISDKQTI